MNQIHEKDWAADDYWGGHSGMRSNPYNDEPDSGKPENNEKTEKKDNGQSDTKDTNPQNSGQNKKIL